MSSYFSLVLVFFFFLEKLNWVCIFFYAFNELGFDFSNEYFLLESELGCVFFFFLMNWVLNFINESVV